MFINIMIKIRVFSSFSPSDFDSSEPFIRTSELKDDPDYNNLYCFTNANDYTHAILLNTPMPKLTIPKDNVIGLAFEPIHFLGLTQQFLSYAKTHIGKYYIGDKMDLPMPFIEHFAYMWYRTPLKTIQPNKTKVMSIMISEKLNAPGHKYRHILVQEILKTNLPINIYGRGCELYKNVNDIRIKGKFDNNEIYDEYMFHICIENFTTSHYFSEKIMNTLVSNTTPIYWGCKNIHSYFDDAVINLTGDVGNDIELLKRICQNPDEYIKKLDIDSIKKTINIKNVINEWL